MDSPPEGSRIVIYARNSSTGQENSTDDQSAVLEREVHDRGWVLVRTYVDARIIWPAGLYS